MEINKEARINRYFAFTQAYAAAQILYLCTVNLPLTNQTIQFNHANRPIQIQYNTHKITFTYGGDDQRRKTEQFENNQLVKTKYFLGNFEREISSTTTKDFNYIFANGKLVAILIETGNIRDMYYTCTDYLGNINMIIDQNRNIAQETSFDAWGRRRNTTDWSYSNITAPALIKRGFTGHEHLDEFGLINMNARLYDPFICRMLSADNVLFDATNSQNYNRYSYVLNNPLKYSDPTGNVPKGGPSAPIMPQGLSHIDFYDNYEMYRANTIKQEKDETLALIMMKSGGGDSGGNNGMVGSEGDPVPKSKVTMRQTEAYFGAGIGWRGKTNGVNVSGVSTANGVFGLAVDLGINSTLAGQGKYITSLGIVRDINVAKLTQHSTPYLNAGNILKSWGRYSTYFSVALDSYAWWNNQISGTKFGLNTGVTTWGLSVGAAGMGIPAFVGGAMYFGIDALFPGGFNGALQNNGSLINQNQQILGPSFNLYRDH